MQFHPDNKNINLSDVNALLEEGDTPAARALCQSYCKRKKKDPAGWLFLANIAFTLELYEEAERSCLKTISLRKSSAEAHVLMGRCQLIFKKLDKAERYLSQAIKLNDRSVTAHIELGNLYYNNRRYEDAINCFLAASKLSPDDIDLRYRLADLYEQSHDYAAARNIIQKILEVEPEHVRSIILLSRIEKHGRNYELSCSYLEKIMKIPATDIEQAVAMIELGQIFDIMGNYDEANRVMSTGQLKFADSAGQGVNRTSYPERISKCKNWFTQERVSSWKRQKINSDKPALAFIVGFPRSGTTLTEKLLASHADITTIDEQVLIDDLIVHAGKLHDNMGGYPDLLTSLSDQHILDLREHYWRSLKETCGSINTNVLVDKLPLNLIHLGFINRLFPEARIIVALRDPRDVCLSCFMQLFKLNEVTIHFTDLISTVRLYVQTMDLLQHYLSCLPVNTLISRYEDLVTELEPNARTIIAHLDLPWEPSVLDYCSRKNLRGVSTPSNVAITKPVYTSSIDRWKNYYHNFQEVLPMLEPFVDAFGYGSPTGK